MKRNNRIWLTYLAVTAVLVTIASCSRNIIYNHYETVSIDGWQDSDSLLFVTDSVDQRANCHATLHVRYTGLYPFRELTLVVNQRVKPSGWCHTDTVTLELTDDDGHSLGTGNIHHDIAAELPTLPLFEGDVVNISVAHHMHQGSLPGITDVGIQIERP